jgi:hypothetical protein
VTINDPDCGRCERDIKVVDGKVIHIHSGKVECDPTDVQAVQRN